MHEQRQDERRDVDQHQRHEDLVGVVARAQERGNRRPQHAADHARQQHQRQHQRRLRAVERERDAAAEDRAHDELAFRADVPHVGAVADGESHRAEHDGARLQQQLADVVERVDRLDEEHVERLPRVLAHRAEQHEADDEHRGGRDDRGEPAREARRLGTRFEPEAGHGAARTLTGRARPRARSGDAPRRRVNERPGHQQADLLGVGFVHRLGVGQPALRDHREPVADLEELVQFLRHDEHRDAVVAQVEQRLPDLRGRADVHAPRGLRGDHELRLLADLAAHDVLLQIAAGQAARDGVGAARLHAVRADRLDRVRAHDVGAHEPARDHAFAIRGQQRIVGERHLRHRAAAQPFLGHEREAERAPLRRVEAARRGAEDRHGVRFRERALARQRRHQFLLAVARHAGDADDLARAHRQVDAGERRAERVVGRQREVADDERVRARPRFAMLRMREVAADHHPRERRRRLAARVALAGDLARAQHGRLVAQRADLVELVADVEDAAALVGQAAQRLEELLDRLRRQHRRGLVHDEEARVLQQAAHDLDALPLADRHRVHVAGGVERKSVLRRHVADARRKVVARAIALQRERDVVGDRQRLEQREVLEDHADAEPARARRIGDDDGLAFPRDRPGVGLDRAVDDLHQRRLAGAVLAQHRVDLAGQNREVDAGVGDDARVDLRDAGELEAGWHGGVGSGSISSRRSTERVGSNEGQSRLFVDGTGVMPATGRRERESDRSISRSARISAATATAMAPGLLAADREAAAGADRARDAGEVRGRAAAGDPALLELAALRARTDEAEVAPVVRASAAATIS